MRDVLVRLSYCNADCTCAAWDQQPHDELCMYRIVRDAEAEILRLRNLRPKGDRPDSGSTTRW